MTILKGSIIVPFLIAEGAITKPHKNPDPAKTETNSLIVEKHRSLNQKDECDLYSSEV